MRRPARPVAPWCLAAPLSALVVALAACGDDGDPLDTCGGEIEHIELPGPDPLVFERLETVQNVAPTFRDGCGAVVTPPAGALTWESDAPEVATVAAVAGAQQPTGAVRAVGFGVATVSVSVGEARAELPVQVVLPDTAATGFTVLGRGEAGLVTTDLWVHGAHAYSGSQPWSCPSGCESLEGYLYVWHVPPGGRIEKVDSVAVPAANINDVKVAADGSFAVVSQELGAPGENGIVVLGLADPAAPSIVAHYTQGLDAGVHNVWIERLDGRDYVFVVVDDPSPAGGLRIVDVTDRSAPREVASFYAGSSIVHDVYVRDGLAFVSHWNAGLVILDVGNGTWGGAPDAPVEVGRVVTEGGNVHNAWYWPEERKVFVGEERFGPPGSEGVMHVVDVTDPAAPVEVATFAVPGMTPHNFWLDEDGGVLFVGWYEKGLRAVDVGGTLEGDLTGQGRELGFAIPSGQRGAANVWAPQLHQGVVYISDIPNGLWSLRFEGG